MIPSPTDNAKNDYAQYLSKGMEILHSRETRGAIISLLSGNKTPVQRVANAAVVVLQKVDGAARSKGLEIQDATKLFAAYEIVKQICEIADAARLFTLDDQHQNLALSVAVQDYVRAEIAAGRIDPARLNAQITQGMRKLTPEQRSEVDSSIKTIQQTGAKYRG